MDSVGGGPIYAGFWRRGAAYIVDSLVLAVPNYALVFLLRDAPLGALAGQIAIWWLYLAGMESSTKQATLGKMALGIKVTDLQGGRISFARATGRVFAMVPSGMILFIGFLMAAFTARKQALHDLMAGCLVVRASATDAEVREGSGTMPVTAGVWVGIVVFLIFPVLGILAAVAIPAYQDYSVRAKMVEVMTEGAARRSEAAQEIRAYREAAPEARGDATHTAAGRSRYVREVVVNKPGRTLDLVLAPGFGVRLEPDARVRFTLADDGATWTCRGIGVSPRYLPPSCRS